MRILLILCILVGVCVTVQAEVKLFRYTDKLTGEERGICYSDKDGNSSINNSEWGCEVIAESQKDEILERHKEQLKAKFVEEDSMEKRIAALELQIKER